MSDDISNLRTLWDAAITVVITAIGWILRRLVSELDRKADRRDLDRLEEDVRQRQNSQDTRAAQRDVEHGRLLGMLRQWERRTHRRSEDDEE